MSLSHGWAGRRGETIIGSAPKEAPQMTNFLVTMIAVAVAAVSYMAGTAVGRGGPTYRYFETELSVAGNHENVRTFTCPNGYNAISGYWHASATGLVSDYNTVETKNHRRWTVGVLNFNAKAEKAEVGVVCARG
jgi:hypothetical protein